MAHARGTAPAYGTRLARLLAVLSLAGLSGGGVPGVAQRLPYLPVPFDTGVLPRRAVPRIAYPKLPRDTAPAAPFAYDDLAEPLPSAAQQAVLARRVTGQDYAPAPAIWKIADRDTTIYLFGTIHVLPPGFAWRNAVLERVVRQSKRLIVESVDDGGVAGLMQATPGAAPLPPLSARVSRSHRRKLAAFMAGLPADAARTMDGLPTWIAAVAVGFVRDYRAGEVPGPGADDWLEAQFRARRLPVEAIEDGGQVLDSVNAIPAAEQRRMLDAALDARQPERAALHAPLHAWARGDVGPGSALAVDLAANGGSPALNDALMRARNTAWAARLRRMLGRRGTMLFAGGAGHFVGRGSVIELLQRDGVRVTRVQ